MNSKDMPDPSGESGHINQTQLHGILTERERTQNIGAIPIGFNNEVTPYIRPILEATDYSEDSAFGQFLFLTAATNLFSGYIVTQIRKHTIKNGTFKGELAPTAKGEILALQALQRDLHEVRRTMGVEIFGDKAIEYTKKIHGLFDRATGGQDKKGIQEEEKSIRLLAKISAKIFLLQAGE